MRPSPLRLPRVANGGWMRYRTLQRLRRDAVVVMPCAAALLIALPLVIHGLPDYESHLGEEYQPLKALKFFQSRGREFHKWGPADNFLYAPGYALSLLYWKHRGTFGPASNRFPYGFHQPLRQLTALILQSRILLLSFLLFSLAMLALSLVQAGFSRLAACFALLVCLATNPVMIWEAVVLKADGPMIGFSSLALAFYVIAVRSSPTRARAFWLFTFIAWAVSAKELAIPLFLLPCAAILFEAFKRSSTAEVRARWREALRVGALTFAGWYVLLNVVYAPATWLRRVSYALKGPDPEVWGAPDRPLSRYLVEIFQALTDNLGPGGISAAACCLAALIWLRPKGAWLLALPGVSFILLGFLPLGYFPDRFALPAALALTPLVACAVDALRERLPARGLGLALASMGTSNLVYANIAWLQLDSRPEDLIENYVRAHLAKDESFSVFSFWPRIPGKSRLEALGYRLDPRPMGVVIRSGADLPKNVFITSEQQTWVEDLARMPKRAAMVSQETGFEPADWNCFKKLGYRLALELRSPLPRWYPFGFLPLPASAAGAAVLVYRLDPST